ncbi:MAG: SurA N-terminal domain-containing protein [Ostreibacterium sp.]
MSLEDIREKKHNKWVYVVIGLLLLGMAGFGTSQFGLGGGQTSQTLLETGNTEISMTEYNNMLRYVQQNNPDISAEKAQVLAIGALKQRVAIADYISRYPLAASNEQIDNIIRKNPSFFDNGQFSEAAFRRVISIPPENYRQDVSKDLAMQEFQSLIAETSVVSQVELKPYLDIQNLSRDMVVVKIAKDKFSATANDAEIKAYYNTHKATFMTDEQVDIKYIDYNPSNIASKIVVTKAEMAKSLAPPRAAHYYLFTNEAKAKAAYTQLQSGKAITDIKTTMANAIEDSGELTELTATASKDSPLPQQAIDQIFTLENIGDITKPVTVDGGVYLFELTKKLQANTSELIRLAAKQKLQKEKAAPQITQLSEKLNQAVFESSAPSLNNIAEATGLKAVESGLISVNNPQGILTLPELAQAISKSDKTIGKFQEPVTIGDRVIIYQLETLKLPEQKPLASVKSQVSQLVIREKINQQMADTVKQLITKANEDELANIAKTTGYPTQDYPNFNVKKVSLDSKGLLGPMMSLLIAREPLKLKQALEIKSPVGDTYIYETTAVRLLPSTQEARKALSVRLSRQVGEMELSNFIQSVTLHTKIKDHSSLLLTQ